MSARSMTVTLPEELLTLVEDVCRKEHRTRSELVREALRRYIRAAEQEPPLHGWQREILAERLAAAKARPGEGSTWAEVEAELWPET
jgi:Arc/MetJ-type ribon-helix-helix transcriptional regulator